MNNRVKTEYNFIPRILIILITILLSFSTGCSTFNKKRTIQWSDFVAPGTLTTNSMIVVNNKQYSTSCLQGDMLIIENLITELDSLTEELSLIIWRIKTLDKAYITDTENKDGEYILFKFINARDALWDIVNFYRHASYPDANTRTKGAALAMLGGINLNYYTSRLIALSINNKHIIKILNAAHSKYEIPKGSYNKLFLAITDIDNISLVDTAWKLFSKELYTPNSNLQKLIEENKQYKSRVNDLQKKYFEAYIQTRYILFSSGKIFPNIENHLRHSPISSIERDASNITTDSVYALKGSIFKNVSRIKNPTTHILIFSPEQITQIKSLLQPGDILLTYTSGYMSNIFLPGKFKHGITYIGTVEQRQNIGLTDKAIKQHTISEKQFNIFTNNMEITSHPKGYPANVIEAVAEGVIINSLDYLLKTHINRMLVLRPKISAKERITQLATQFNYIGTPYDFNFNFSDDSHQCCTELIYRTLNNKGNINLSFTKTKGKWVLTADDIVNYYLNSPSIFNIILLADAPEKISDNKAVIYTGQDALYHLKELMQ